MVHVKMLSFIQRYCFQELEILCEKGKKIPHTKNV